MLDTRRSLVRRVQRREVRQEYEVTYLGRPISGVPTVNDEASAVHWVAPSALDEYDIHPTMRRQLDDYLTGRYPVAD